MQSSVVTKSYKVRALAFAVVLLISGMLVFTLLQEARAVDIRIDSDSPTSVSGNQATFTVEVEIPQNQVFPILSTRAIIEKTPSSTKANAEDWAAATCAQPMVGCTNDGAPALTEEMREAITAIRLHSDASERVNTEGYSIVGCNDTGANFGNGNCDWTHTGYRYNGENGHGYGYWFPDLQGTGYTFNNANTFGYGYHAGNLIFKFQVVVNPNALGSGNFHLTFHVNTGSGITGANLQSGFHSFSVGTAGGGPGGGTDDGDGGDGDVDSVVDAVAIDAPEGALEAWRAVVTGNNGDTIRINTGSDRVPRVDFTLDADVTATNIDIIIWPPGNPPPGVDALPGGTSGVYFVQITIDAGGDGHTSRIYIQIPTGEMNALPEQAMGLKFGSWIFLGAMELTMVGDNYAGDFSGSCCSTFAVAFDEENPSLNLTADMEAVVAGNTVTFTAEADDNVEMDRVDFYVGDTLMHTDDDAPFTWEWMTGATDIGTNSVEARAFDGVGNSEQATTSVEVEPTPSPDDDTRFPWGTVLLILVILAVIAGAVWYFVNQKKSK